MVKISYSHLILVFAASASNLMKGFLESLPTSSNSTNSYTKTNPMLFHPPAMVASQGTSLLPGDPQGCYGFNQWKSRCSGLLNSVSTEIQRETENYFSPQTTKQS